MLMLLFTRFCEKLNTKRPLIVFVAICVLGDARPFVDPSQDVQASILSSPIVLVDAQQKMDYRLRLWDLRLISYDKNIEIPKAIQKEKKSNHVFHPSPSLQPSPTEYRQLFETLKLKNKRSATIKDFKKRLTTGRLRYERVAEMTGVPWYVVGIIHYLEYTNNFDVHFHTGAPLNDGMIWEESAANTLQQHGLDKVSSWTLEETLYRLERYNGLGYRNRGIYSPYLWGGSTHYIRGKFSAKGNFNSDRTYKQIGAAVLLKFALPKDILNSVSWHQTDSPQKTVGTSG